MKITICVGSSCYLKGSKDIISILQRLITLHGLDEKVTLMGSFCMGFCTEGVCVKVDEERFSLSPASTEDFFNTQVLARVDGAAASK